MQYWQPEYRVDLTPEKMAICRDLGQRLLEEIGITVKHEKFVAGLKGKDGLTFDGDRIRIGRKLSDGYIDEYIEQQRKELADGGPPAADRPWSLSCGGFSMAVLDPETDKPRPATSRDLRDCIRLVRSVGIGGSYPCIPQDVPPNLRALNCFRICHEEADNISMWEYYDSRAAPYVYEMSRVVDQKFIFIINVPGTLTLSDEDIDVLMTYYPAFKKDPDRFAWYAVADYPMLGVSKPITSTGSIAHLVAHCFGTHILLHQFDPALRIPFGLSPGMPVDLQNMCWAFGSPRTHLYAYLSHLVLPAFCGVEPRTHVAAAAAFRSSSCAPDFRAGMEKMASALMAAMQGARSFGNAGSLCVDDLFSGVQLLLDVELFEYIKELMESFHPHPDILTTEGLWDVLGDVGTGEDEYYSHPDTATKIRDLLPVSPRRPHEKLRAWMAHGKNMIDRVREEVKDRIRAAEPYQCDEGVRKELDKIYRRAEREIGQVQ